MTTEYKTKLDSYEMQRAISFIKDVFQEKLRKELNLKRVSAPLFVLSSSGLNDNLSGTERPVTFDIPYVLKNAEVVHSLAKWKRLALKRYCFHIGEGLYTDMNAIRRDETLDDIHSIYVDQWDWEKIIEESDRNIEFLKDTVKRISNAIYETNLAVNKSFKEIKTHYEKNVVFITAKELEDMYPALTPQERENEFAKIHKTIFIIGIGEKLKSGEPHSMRAPDYDDWSLNGDLIVYNEVLNKAFELSSMGIRVDRETLISQLEKSNHLERMEYPFHKMLLNDELPLTIGGGIGESRLCMFLLGTIHIGEVQSSIWDDGFIEEYKKRGINIL